MAYPTTHRFDVAYLSGFTASIGSSPTATHVRAPFRGLVEKIAVVTHGLIATTDCSVAIALNGTAISGSPLTIPVASAAAGQVASMVPTSPTYMSEDDVLSFTPSAAAGSTIGGTFTVRLKGDRG
jgi:hypothetical protein